MTFTELDRQMRAFESREDARIPACQWLVARLDGRGFTRLTKEKWDLEKPFDARFHDAMAQTLAHLFDCGFAVRLGFSQSDEISLLLEPHALPFERKTRKILSILAGEASAHFSIAMQSAGVFDCRLSALPDDAIARDYFRWRQSDGTRNALNAHLYWKLRTTGMTGRAATSQLDGLTVDEKRARLGGFGVDFDALPRWHRHGFAACWENYMKRAFDPKRDVEVEATRKRLKLERELAQGEEFGCWLNERIIA